MSIKKLKQKKETLEDELYNLHFNEPRIDEYHVKRLNIELQISKLENIIQYEKALLPFKYTMWIAITLIIVVTILSIIF